MLRRRSRAPGPGPVRWSGLALTLLSLSACHTHTHATHPDEDATDEDAAIDPSTRGADDETSSGATVDDEGSSAPASTSASEQADLPPRLRYALERQQAFATELLDAAPTQDAGGPLVFVIGQKTADLPWVFAIENRGESEVLLDADMTLLSIELSPKGAENPEESGMKALACNLPLKTGLAQDAEVLLGPGQALVHSFDPRRLCPEEALIEGVTVRAIYGYELQTQKKWERGKMVVVTPEQTAPFVADSANTHIKRLEAEPFVLNETYPLNEWNSRAPDDPARIDHSIPRAPLEVSLNDLGSAASTDYKVVTVQLKNVSDRSIDLLVRRELFAYEVQGPLGTASCYMEPTNFEPLPHQYSRLAPGQTRVLSTRLPEACPADTFLVPGTYSVFVRYTSTSSGERDGKQGFVGQIVSAKPAHFEIKGTRPPARRLRIFQVPER